MPSSTGLTAFDMAEPTYTIFVRVPIPRGDFVDPPQVDWDSSKDDALWRLLSGAAQTDINWNKTADRFNVPVDFLLKQVTYLTDRHASQVRLQIQKATAAVKVSNAPSPAPGSDSAIQQRTASAQSQRRDTTPMGSGSGTPVNDSMRPVVSRKVSANTTGSGYIGGTSSPRIGAARSVATRSLDQGGRKRLPSVPIAPNPAAPANTPLTSVNQQPEPETERSPSPEPAPSSPPSSEDEEEEEEDSEPAQSRIIRRPPHFRTQDARSTYDVEDDDDDEPAFQAKPSVQGTNSDMSSTLRGDNKATPVKRNTKTTSRRAFRNSQNSDSDTSSPSFAPNSRSHDQRTPGPLSPRRAAVGTGNVRSREGSDGTPSMGSSFSDLEDASVTQSALEEAMASQLGRGGSRFSSLSQAFRSRQWPSGN